MTENVCAEKGANIRKNTCNYKTQSVAENRSNTYKNVWLKLDCY